MIGKERIFATSAARNIGVALGAHLDMVVQVSSVCKASYVQLHNISRIRKCLRDKTPATLINALVTSKLDNNNSILFGLPGYVQKPSKWSNNVHVQPGSSHTHTHQKI